MEMDAAADEGHPPTGMVASAFPTAGDLFDAALGQVWVTVSSTPWLLALLALLVGGAVVQVGRGLIHGLHGRDPERRFSSADKRIILARAGHRCEHHHPLYGRCKRTDGLQADHVHPHSRGGWTAVENAQALCARHNRGKSARVPWKWQLDRLARRRAAYFPPGTPTGVTRHRPRQRLTERSPTA